MVTPDYNQPSSRYRNVFVRSDMKRLTLAFMIVFIHFPLLLSLAANSGTTNCGVLTLTVTCLTITSHCQSLVSNLSASVMLTHITKTTTSLAHM